MKANCRRTNDRGDFLLMAILQIACTAGFGVAASGCLRTADYGISGTTGGFALLCFLLAIRNFRFWRSFR
jgi:hypothetical protein